MVDVVGAVVVVLAQHSRTSTIPDANECRFWQLMSVNTRKWQDDEFVRCRGPHSTRSASQPETDRLRFAPNTAPCSC
jgi:hypothetical protein